jgi:hypothetical protein
MSRKPLEALRRSPLCNTPLDETTSLGLRDYRWVSHDLPGRIGPTDADLMLHSNGEVLVVELKPSGAVIPTGQRMALRVLFRKAITMWVG